MVKALSPASSLPEISGKLSSPASATPQGEGAATRVVALADWIGSRLPQIMAAREKLAQESEAALG